MNFFSKYDYDSLFGHFGNGITDKHEFMKGKVNSVQEACAKCFAVHILKFEILLITWKKLDKITKTSIYFTKS